MISLPGYVVNNDLRLDQLDTRNGAGGGIIVYSKSFIKLSHIKLNSDVIQAVAFSVNLQAGEVCHAAVNDDIGPDADRETVKILAFYICYLPP